MCLSGFARNGCNLKMSLLNFTRNDILMEIRSKKVPDAVLAAVQDNREPGGNPGRSRRCIRGAFFSAGRRSLWKWEDEKM